MEFEILISFADLLEKQRDDNKIEKSEGEWRLKTDKVLTEKSSNYVAEADPTNRQNFRIVRKHRPDEIIGRIKACRVLIDNYGIQEHSFRVTEIEGDLLLVLDVFRRYALEKEKYKYISGSEIRGLTDSLPKGSLIWK